MVVVLQDDTKVVVESVSKKSRMEITFSPIHMAYYVNGELKITVNDKNLFYFEVTRTKSVDHPETTKVEEKVEEKKIVDYTEGGHAIYEDGTIEGETAPVEPETEAEVSADGSTMPSEPTTESSSGEDAEKEDGRRRSGGRRTASRSVRSRWERTSPSMTTWVCTGFRSTVPRSV